MNEYLKKLLTTEVPNSDGEKTIFLSKIFDKKDIYEKYRDRTVGTYSTYIETLFKHLTSPTKSKYDNVIGWVRLK